MKTMRNEYRDLKKENDLIFSTLAEYDRDTITEIIGVVDNTRGIGYEVELVLLEHVVQKFAGGTLAIQHEDWERLQLAQCNRAVFHRKIGLIGDEYIVEFAQHMDILRSTEPGVWIVRQNKIDLTVVQKPRTFDGGTVGNLDVDIRVALVKFA